MSDGTSCKHKRCVRCTYLYNTCTCVCNTIDFLLGTSDRLRYACVLMPCQKWKCQQKYWQLSWIPIWKLRKVQGVASNMCACAWYSWICYSSFNIDDDDGGGGNMDATSGYLLEPNQYKIFNLNNSKYRVQAICFRLRSINLTLNGLDAFTVDGKMG